MTSTTGHQSRYSLPKPETGVAEWASKIKAMQQQVDADEEAEQRKLEEEITASRMARLRRSRGIGGPSRKNSLDLSSMKDSIISSDNDDATTDSETAKSFTERQRNQTSALQKLTGSSVPSTPQPKRAEPMSLAAFMGGRATGPRLNKHAPQQDAHDPTQFEQRTQITTPHPVFGRGGVAMSGVAMPGLASRSVSAKSDSGREPVASEQRARGVSFPAKAEETHSVRPLSPQKTGGRDRTSSTPAARPLTGASTPRSSTPSVVSRYADNLQERSISPQKTDVRERTVSTPTGSSPFKRPVPAEPATLNFSRHSSSGHKFPPELHVPSPSLPPSSRPHTPASTTTPIPTSPRKESIATHSLARPIRPDPRSSPKGPQIPPSQKPSPAFLKPPPSKDPTPSLSRLKGRGFVADMVKFSQHREASPNSSTPSTPDKAGAGRKVVLDRWPAVSQSSPPSSPPVAPKPMALRKSFTADQVSSIHVPKPPEMRRPTKSAAASFSAPHEVLVAQSTGKTAAESSTGLGSRTTLMIIKPTTTAPDEDVTHTSTVDELGVQQTTSVGPGTALRTSRSQVDLPAPSGKPLVHPTKERARKPKKTNDGTSTKIEVPTTSRPLASARSRSLIPSLAQPSQGHTLQSSPTTIEPIPLKTGRVRDRWSGQDVIGVKQSSQPAREVHAAPEVRSSGMAGRRALPGMAPSGHNEDSGARITPKTHIEETRLPTPSPPASVPREEKQPTTPGRHARIPSTGKRARVMDVAQVLNDQAATAVIAPDSLTTTPLPEQEIPVSPTSPTANLRPQSIAPPSFSVERRRSSYEKYSAIILPPLKEEATPTATPAGTLTRGIVRSPIEIGDTISEKLEEQVNNEVTVPLGGSELIHFSHTDAPLPSFDIDALLKSRPRVVSLESRVQSISVDVVLVQGNTLQTLSQDTNVFYDSEILGIVHRAKSKSSGLVSTQVWGWQGKNSSRGDREEQKLNDLAKRYGTSVIPVHQCLEPAELVQIIGGQLIVRQGLRAHWSAENTSMHLVRSLNGVSFIDELDLNIKNLCSGFSYCITVIGNIYVWHGVGSVPEERQAAMQYAQTLGSSIVEMSQGKDDDDEMFWMYLGDDGFARADYWKWRPTASRIVPQVWRVDFHGKHLIVPVDSFMARSSVFVVDCIWEIFVVVGVNARGRRDDIRLAVSVAEELASHVAPERPYRPTVHVVVLPTQVPVDLRLHFRDVDEALLNGNDVPDHMNLLSIQDANDHLRRQSWDRASLKDETMLPLGLDATTVSV